jgi:hypothetical protein
MYNWSTGTGRSSYNWSTGRLEVAAPKTSEPISSRAEDYKSPGDNSSPAGETIAAIIGTASFDGKIVWWDDFRLVKEKVSASFAMVFADCIFTDSASLLKLFADEMLIVSNQVPTRQSPEKIRFYDGSQTAVDPLLTAKLGAANATAWPGFIYAVFEDFDCSPYGNRIPLMRAGLSGAVTDTAASETQSTLTFGSFVGFTNQGFAVDHFRGHHYQLVDGGANNWYIVTVDIASMVEIDRVLVYGAATYGDLDLPVALYGTDFIVCASDDGLGDQVPTLINAHTGQIVDTLSPAVPISLGGGWELSPKRAVLLQSGSSTKYLVVTEARDPYEVIFDDFSLLGVFVADVTAGTLEWIIHPEPTETPALGKNQPYSVEFGPVTDGVATIWYTSAHVTEIGAVNVVYVTDVGFTEAAFYVETVSGKAPKGVAYDPVNSILVVYRSDGSFLKLNANTGALVSTHSGAITDFNINTGNDDAGVQNWRMFVASTRPGFILATRGQVNGDVYQIDLSTMAASLLIDQSDFSDDSEGKFFDQFLGWQTEASSSAGIINKVSLGGSTPDTVDLQDIFIQLATFDDRWESGDLTFTGFPGNETSGLKLENDTTVDNLETSIAELFDVKIVPSDGNRKYFFPARDGSFAVTATLAATDFVERGSQTIEKTFGAGEDEFVGAAVAYFDVDADYKKIEQSYTRPIGIYDVTRSKKKRTFNSLLSLTAGQAMQAATLLTYRSVLGNESYSFSLVPGKSHIEPADYLSIPFRDTTAIVRVKEATLKADYTQDVVVYQYLEFADATFTGAPLEGPGGETVSVAVRLIYLDLPLLSYSHDQSGSSLVQYVQIVGFGEGIINAAAYNSDDGDTYVSLGIRSGMSPIAGVITSISGTPTNPFVKDETNSITVLINAGDSAELETITDDEFTAEVNIAAIGQPGRWVLLLFQTVSTTNNIATLSDLMWGIRGSEVWIDELEEGDQFILINPEHYIRFKYAAEFLDDEFFYKAASIGAPLELAATIAKGAAGVAETPYAPTNLDAVVDGSDVDITWDYRSRIATGTNPANHGEATLAFEIDIMGTDSPLSVLRTLTATTNAVTYTAAQIAADFGGIPAFLTFRVYMMSALDILVPGQEIVGEGRGYVAEATVQLGATGMPIGLLLTLTYV